MEDLIGKTIKIKKEHVKAVESVKETFDTARTAYDEAVIRIQMRKRELFDLIRKLYPELDGYEFTVHHKTNEISITAIRLSIKGKN